MGTTSTISELAPDVANRLQDPAYVFWNEQFEVYAALAEAISELMLIVGRPTVAFNQAVTIQPNTCFQSMPENVLSITGMQCNGSQIKKTTLHSLDYVQSSWGSAWQSDRAALSRYWAPLGLSMFIVYPAVLQPVQVSINAIQYPIQTSWPPNGSEESVFHKEVDQALQMYAAAYCRVKECGNDFFEGQSLYKQFLEIGKRLTVIEDRRDNLIWNQSFGAATAPSKVSAR